MMNYEMGLLMESEFGQLNPLSKKLSTTRMKD